MRIIKIIPTLLLSGITIVLNAELPLENKQASSGSHYYLSPNGNDGSRGTMRDPWKTLEKANQSLKPGDTATFLNGTYDGNISPVSDGEGSQKAITYLSAKRHGAILTGKEGTGYIIRLEGKHYITIDGFKMLPVRGGFGQVRNCSHITLRNCHMENSSEVFVQLHFIDSHYNRILNNNMSRVVQRTRDSKIHGDGCRLTNSTHNLIEGNSFSKIGHSPLNLYAVSPELCSYNIIRGNCLHNGWGRNFELFNPDRCLFENNVITDAFNGSMSASSQIQPFFYNSIFRNNLVYDNWDGVIVTNSWDAMLGGEKSAVLEFVNSRIYNNTFTNNPSTVWIFATNKAEPAVVRTNKFMNNLFSHNGFTDDFTAFVLGPGVTPDNIFHNNLFYGDQKGREPVQVLDKNYSATSLNREFPERFRNNIDADPLFVSFPDRNFALTSGSPAFGAGSYLTNAASSGRGKELQVGDARFFFDGFGIEGEQGDIITVGKPMNLARVVRSDIDKNLLTLDRDLTWREGDPVSLPYAGKAPDIGAIPYGNTGVLRVISSAHPVSAGRGKEVTFSAAISGQKGKVNMEWDLGDGTITREASPRHAYKDYGDYVIRLLCSDASGSLAKNIFLVRVERTIDPGEPLMQSGFEEEDFEEWGHLWDRGPSRESFTYFPEKREDGKGDCMCVSTQGKNRTLAVNVKFRTWDIDKYPFIKLSYRIPIGVPVGVWLRPWPARDRPEKVCIAGSPANSAGKFISNDNYKLEDDGIWHQIVIDARDIRKDIPGSKLLYSFEFSTYAQTKEGQKFWFDDFLITPVRPR